MMRPKKTRRPSILGVERNLTQNADLVASARSRHSRRPLIQEVRYPDASWAAVIERVATRKTVVHDRICLEVNANRIAFGSVSYIETEVLLVIGRPYVVNIPV